MAESYRLAVGDVDWVEVVEETSGSGRGRRTNEALAVVTLALRPKTVWLHSSLIFA